MTGLNQAVTWRRRTASDPYAGDSYAESQIKVRWETTRYLVRSREGAEVVSEALVITQAKVTDGDTLIDAAGREWPVISVGIVPDLGGHEHHREVRL